MTVPVRYRLELLPERDPTFRVSVGAVGVGTIRHFYIRHMKMYGWEATGPDGHLAVHEHRWQALWALTWDRKGYPFPVAKSHERHVIINGSET